MFIPVYTDECDTTKIEFVNSDFVRSFYVSEAKTDFEDGDNVSIYNFIAEIDDETSFIISFFETYEEAEKELCTLIAKLNANK